MRHILVPLKLPIFEPIGTPYPNGKAVVVRTRFEQCHAKMFLRNLCGQKRPRTDCACAQSDLGLHCPLTESLNTSMYTSRKHAYTILYSKTGIYRGIHYFFYFYSKTDCGYSLEPSRRGGSNEYQQFVF